MDPNGRTLLIRWGFAAAPMPAQVESGDRHVVKEFPHGMLFGVVDGLGHGSEAAVAARVAIAILENNPSESVISLAKRCHDGLTQTRGVVMSLASIDTRDETMTWLGIGNVDGVLLRADTAATPPQELLVTRGGVVGYRLPGLVASVIPISRGDTLIFTTDGIRSGVSQQANPIVESQRLADQILQQGATGADDALVLVAKFVGSAP